MATLATSAVLGLVSTGLGVVTSLAQSSAQSSAMKQQAALQEREAAVEEQRAAVERLNAETREKEERAVGQRDAAQRMREARLSQSRLKATAGASGSSSSDKTVLDIFDSIGAEGRYNAQSETAYADQRTTGIRNQANLDQWGAQQSAANMRYSAASTRSQANSVRTGGYLSAFGAGLSGVSPMINRYGGYTSRRTYG